MRQMKLSCLDLRILCLMKKIKACGYEPYGGLDDTTAWKKGKEKLFYN